MVTDVYVVELRCDSRERRAGYRLISLPSFSVLVWIFLGQCAGPIRAGDGARGKRVWLCPAFVRHNFIYFSCFGSLWEALVRFWSVSAFLIQGKGG